MILNFPDNPQTGDQYTGDNGVLYVFDGVKWLGKIPSLTVASNSISNNGHVVQVDVDGNLVIPAGSVILDELGLPVSSSQLRNDSMTVSLTTSGVMVLADGSNIYNDGADLRVDTTASFQINAYTGPAAQSWTFGLDGSLAMPGQLSSVDGFTLVTDHGSLLLGTQHEILPTLQHFHIMAMSTSTDLYVGDEYNYIVRRGETLGPFTTYGVEIGTKDAVGGPQQMWRFGTDGVTIFPNNHAIGTGEGDMIVRSAGGVTLAKTLVNTPFDRISSIQVQNNVSIYTAEQGVNNQWIFRADGSTVFPEGTIAGDATPLNIATHPTAVYGPYGWNLLYQQVDGPISGSDLNDSNFTIAADRSGTYSITDFGPGNTHSPGDSWTVLGTGLGGTSPANDAVITVSTVLSPGGEIETLTITGIAVSKQWTFGTDASLTLPPDSTIIQNSAQTTTIKTNIPASTSTVIHTAGPAFTSCKLVITVEGHLDGDSTGTNHTQLCEATIAAIYNSSIEPVMSVYGRVYTSPEPLATFTVRRGVNNSIEVVALNSQLLETLTASVHAVNIVSTYD